MPEINKRWERDHRYAIRATAYGAALATALWPLSYLSSFYAAWGAGVSFHEVWIGFLVVGTFIGAVGVTIGTVIGLGVVLTDEPPLEGQNH